MLQGEKMENTFAVVGLGKSGISTVKFLVKKGFLPALFDTRSPEKVDLSKYDFITNNKLTANFGPLDANKLMQYKTIIVSPGIAIENEALQKAQANGAEIIGDIELFARYAKAPVIGITGSNGKSTVTTLVYEICKSARLNAQMGGNIGIPALDILEDNVDVYVLELSSFELETTKSLELIGATILNISEDHLDRYHGKMSEYAAAKQRIYAHAKNVVVNRADDATIPINSNAPRVSFGEDDKSYGKMVLNDEEYLSFNGKPIMKVAQIGIKGVHNEMNALAAIALTDCLHVTRDAQIATLRTFTGLAHRCQLAGMINGVSYYNDSKATNVGATLAAVNGLASKGRIILLAGGIGKGQDFTPIKNLLGKEVSFMCCFGRDGKLLADLGVQTKLCNDMKEAIEEARKIAVPGDIVLLAPACASLDQFASFEERGSCFTRIVRGIK